MNIENDDPPTPEDIKIADRVKIQYCDNELIEHLWVDGPFYIYDAGTLEVSDHCPPSMLIKIQHCKRCGLLRLPPRLLKKCENNLR